MYGIQKVKLFQSHMANIAELISGSL